MTRMNEERMEKILDRLPKDPPDMEEWVRENCVAGKYLIYSAKHDTAVCTECGEWTNGISHLKGMHDKITTCPNCGREVVALASGKGRKGRTDYFRLLILNRRGKTVYGMLWEYTADFRGMGRPVLHRWLSAVYTINAKERHYYKHFPAYCWDNERWEEYKTFKVPSPVCSINGMTNWGFTYLRTDTLKSVFEKSDLKYLWVEGWTNQIGPDEMIQYIKYGMMHQSVELLLKAGFRQMVWDKVKGRPCPAINWQGKSLQRILKIPRRHVRKMQLFDPNAHDIRIFQQLSERERDLIEPNMLIALSDYCRHRDITTARVLVGEHLPFERWIRYMNGQVTSSTDILTWVDYINMCHNLGADLRRKTILMPEDLKTAHDMAVAMWHEQKDEIVNERIREHARHEDYTSGGLRIMAADSQKKLNRESAVLNHCVKMYGDKIAGGKCWIWFIRREDDPEKPYYTMETDTRGNMIQCRGDHNRPMTSEVKAFAGQFETYLKNKIKRERAGA